MTGIIDIESIQIDSQADLNRFNITADEAMYRTRCTNKSAFRNAIQKLIEIHQIPATSLRQGEARATRYCEFAIRAVSALKSGNLAQLQNLKAQTSQPVGAIVLSASRHIEIADRSSSAANQNLTAIGDQISNLLASYEQLGEALGNRAGAAIEKGFAQGVSRSLKKISEA